MTAIPPTLRMEHSISKRWEAPPSLAEWRSFIENSMALVESTQPYGGPDFATVVVDRGQGRNPWHSARVTWVTGEPESGDRNHAKWWKEVGFPRHQRESSEREKQAKVAAKP